MLINTLLVVTLYLLYRCRKINKWMKDNNKFTKLIL